MSIQYPPPMLVKFWPRGHGEQSFEFSTGDISYRSGAEFRELPASRSYYVDEFVPGSVWVALTVAVPKPYRETVGGIMIQEPVLFEFRREDRKEGVELKMCSVARSPGCRHIDMMVHRSENRREAIGRLIAALS